LGVSTLVKGSRIAVAISFLIFLFTISFTFATNYISPEYYGDWYLYLGDLNYNFANLYVGMCKNFGFTLPTETEGFFTHFDTFSMFIYDKDLGMMVESNYFHPIVSVIYLGIIAFTLIGVGYLRFKSREIL
jgi:hypothetical protein